MIFDLIIKKPSNIKNDVLSKVAFVWYRNHRVCICCAYGSTVGLYKDFMMGLITAIFGGRPGMISGATGAVAVIFAPLVHQATLNGMDAALSYLFLAVIIGCLQVIFGV